MHTGLYGDIKIKIKNYEQSTFNIRGFSKGVDQYE